LEGKRIGGNQPVDRCSLELQLLLNRTDENAQRIHTNRVLPVSNSCIMPCLRARVFSRRCANAANSASISVTRSGLPMPFIWAVSVIGGMSSGSRLACRRQGQNAFV